MKGISCCGDCINYSYKKHACKMCKDEGKPTDSFYADCWLPDAVPIDETFCEMMNWAARYAIGRRTYAASDTADYIRGLVSYLDEKTLCCLQSDIKGASSLGDKCDEDAWMRLLEAVEKEIKRRGA